MLFIYRKIHTWPSKIFWRQQFIERLLSEVKDGQNIGDALFPYMPDEVMIKEIRASASEQHGFKVKRTQIHRSRCWNLMERSSFVVCRCNIKRLVNIHVYDQVLFFFLFRVGVYQPQSRSKIPWKILILSDMFYPVLGWNCQFSLVIKEECCTSYENKCKL